ncbi:modifier of mdg4-like isoform X20 [Toxorhynchites rutilus septentrionalis]|uniref:modifier of mdg4-like isoform X20 n=1 Tax=Toxorhynchites rutilus septentrionalis TaxID=329112 RepID=UPI002478C1BC|nr:modifier of mdg4-like isoform X20 [Toxorhynchites rutilus septentrionalis]
MADDEQFSLCWNNFNTNLSAGFHESLIQGDLVDVTLAAEGQLVKAHRLILSVCSPYFRKMFTQMPANQHAFIFLKDVSHSALKDLIQFMYCGEVNVKQDALPAFISTAEALQIKGLTETGESAPAQQSPAKDTSHHLPSSGVTTIPSSASSPRAKPVQRSRIQSYKIDSDNESEHEKVVQIQATSTSTNASSSSTGPSATIVATQVSTAPQQVQIIQQQQQAQKRTLQQRASITPQTTQIMKRAKLSDPLEAPEPAQIQTVQIVKQITQTPQPTISSEPEYVEMPIETINPKAEPDYVDDPSEVEAIETEHEHEHEHEQALTEHEAAEHEQDADDNYVEDETYGEMAKYDESYFTEGEEVKAGASGFGSESYTDCGTAADQAAQDSNQSVYRTFIRSQRGAPLLTLDSFIYRCERVRKTRSYWLCIRYKSSKCNGRVICQGNSVIKRTTHCHMNDQRRIASSILEQTDLSAINLDEWYKQTMVHNKQGLLVKRK